MAARPHRVVFLTGTRADYGKLRPLMEEVEADPGLDCRIFVTGMHMLQRYGSTYREVQKGGFQNIFLYINQMERTARDMDLVLASTITGLAHYVRETEPDLIVVHGDRVEALAGAAVGALNNVRVCHIEGGELTGTVDELLRHSVSKLSHVHCVANDEARDRLIQLGEQEQSIWITGSPDIDVMLSENLPSLDEARSRYDIDFDSYHILLYHPVTTELREAEANARAVVDAAIASGENWVVIYPNNDSGSEHILDQYARFEGNPHFRVFPSLRFEHFLVVLKNARSIVGNSSAGIREAPVYGVPTVNIGTRQENRFDYPSIVNVPVVNVEGILSALADLPSNVPPSHHFGSGDAAERFIAMLREPRFWAIPHQKQFVDRG